MGSINVNLELNAKLQPIHRFEIEDMMEEIIEKNELGEVTGGGTYMLPTGEISGCDINFIIYEDKIDDFLLLLEVIDIIPKGSKVFIDNSKEIAVGNAEGLGLYLNGTDLPAEVYQNCDINELIEQLDEALAEIAERLSHWEGEKETALYYYGKNYEVMKNSIQQIIEVHPLCEKCRIVQIA